MSGDAIVVLLLCGVYGIFMVLQGLSSFKATSGSTETFYAADRGVSTYVSMPRLQSLFLVDYLIMGGRRRRINKGSDILLG